MKGPVRATHLSINADLPFPPLSHILHLADVCAPCAAAKRPMTNLKRPMSKRHGPHDQNKTPHDKTTWIARVKLNAIFPVSVGPRKKRENVQLIKYLPSLFNLSHSLKGCVPTKFHPKLSLFSGFIPDQFILLQRDCKADVALEAGKNGNTISGEPYRIAFCHHHLSFTSSETPQNP